MRPAPACYGTVEIQTGIGAPEFTVHCSGFGTDLGLRVHSETRESMRNDEH